jgi:hypothetical protein
MQRFQMVTADTHVVLRPWLQAFAWRTKTYSPQYIETQVATSKANGGDGFLFWNARNDYAKPYTAMPEMRLQQAKYFRGDELSDIPRLQAEHEKLMAERAASVPSTPVLAPAKATEKTTLLAAKRHVQTKRHATSAPLPKP